MIQIVTSFFLPDENIDRLNEILFCLDKNINNSLINRIILVYEQDELYLKNDIFTNSKVILVKIANRPTYRNLIDIANSYLTKSNNEYTILCNNDIYYDYSLSIIENHLTKNKAYALSRYENHLNCYIDWVPSQDTWIFNEIININHNVNFCLGAEMCDWAFAFAIKESGYTISNPAYHIKCIHMHNSNYRKWLPKVLEYQHLPIGIDNKL